MIYIVLLGPFTFIIGDTREFGAYEGGGTVTEVKKPEVIHFVSVIEYLKDEKFTCLFTLFRNHFLNH
jgi:hypothetical protein